MLLCAIRSHSPRNHLCIDDNPALLRLVNFSMTKAGYTVFTAETGSLGLYLAQQEKPDLILLDVILPDTSGYRLCEQLREHTDFDETWIIMLTALANKEGVELASTCGANGYIIKPFNVSKLVSFLNNKLAENISPKDERDLESLLHVIIWGVCIEKREIGHSGWNGIFLKIEITRLKENYHDAPKFR